MHIGAEGTSAVGREWQHLHHGSCQKLEEVCTLIALLIIISNTWTVWLKVNTIKGASINQLFNYVYWLDFDECDYRQLGDTATLQYIEKAGHLVEMERPFVYNKHLKEILATLVEDGHKKQWFFFFIIFLSLICRPVILEPNI
jgi:hypothetical protein